MNVYHYTKGIHLESILQHGLMPSDGLLAEGEKAVLWFTTDPIWEDTVLIGTLQDAYRESKQVGGLVRIVCDEAVAPHTFKALKRVARMPTRMHKALERIARQIDSDPRDWRATLETVPPADFIAVEIFNGREWAPINAVEKAA